MLWLCTAAASAQPAGPPGEERQQIRIAADERHLWLVVVSGSQSRLFFREASGNFDLGRSTNRRIVAQTVLNRDLLVFFDDGAVYRYCPDSTRPTAEAVLPQRESPLEMVSGDGLVYAIISSAAAGELPAAVTDEAKPASQPFDPGESPYSLVIYNGRTWSAVAALPALVQPPGDARPRLCLVQDKLLLFTPGEQPNQLHYFYYDDENRQWISRGTIGVPRAVEYWVVDFSRVPTLVTVVPATSGGEELSVFRLLGDVVQADATNWRPAELKLSDLPEDVTIARYGGAFGFNQHIGLLALDGGGEAYLRFARISDPPAEPTLPVKQVLVEPGVLLRNQGILQIFTWVLLLGVLSGLFVFRRGSMVRVVELPPNCALALNVQRMAAWLIDFTPFTLAVAVLMDIPWGKGLSTLAFWGISPDPEGGVPEQHVFLWWGFSVACYTTYSLVMELISRRTVGKVIARVYLLSEAGTRPTAGQVLTRNLTRLIEFMPQFWIFVVLVMLSRNRQRMGDIFARTVAIRLLPEKPASKANGDKTETRPESDSTDSTEENNEKPESSEPDDD